MRTWESKNFYRYKNMSLTTFASYIDIDFDKHQDNKIVLKRISSITNAVNVVVYSTKKL